MATVRINLRERSLLERIVIGILLLAVLVLGFFFLVAALIAGAILAAVILLRFWWVKRKLAKAADEEFITTEYSVVERESLDRPPVNADERRPNQDAGR
jgi:predicted lipid-binding transport protein (Tim44 family)